MGLRSLPMERGMPSRTLLAIALALACILLAPRNGFAHASLIGAEPADGAVIEAAPRRLVLRFSEPVSPLVLRLVRPDGGTTNLTDPVLRDHSLEITPPADLGRGTHVLSWRVVSADGHPIGGSVVFSVGVMTGAGSGGSAIDADPIVRTALWATRVCLYVGLFVGVGGAFFGAWIAGRPCGTWGQGLVAGALGLGILAAGLSAGLQGLDALAAPITQLTHPGTWAAGLGTRYGVTAMIAAAALLCGAASLATPPRWRARVLSSTALIGVGIACAASGHASTAEPQLLTRASLFVHTVGVAFWVGALIPLIGWLRRGGSECSAVMHCFSSAILPVVAALAIAGAVLAVVQVGSMQALWTTSYGVIQLAKLGTLLGVLGLATLNRHVFTPRLAGDKAGNRANFSRAIGGEIALMVVILGLVAGWRFTPPPRAIQADQPQAAFLHIHSDKGMAELTLTPGDAGRATVWVVLVSAEGVPLEPKEVTLALSSPSTGIEPVERAMHRVSLGRWRTDDQIIPVPGLWQVRIDILVTDFEKLTLEDALEIHR
jgi:copper transport protein